jgi:N-acylglucosamine 2-epimerase
MPLEDRARIAALEREFRNELTGNILPFWLGHGLDRVHGGMTTSLGRRGEILDTDKSVWFQGRAGWTFSTAYSEIERKPEYLEAAKSCIDFIEAHCFDRTPGGDGRMYFRVTREGEPVIKRRRYVFSEAFAAMAMAAYSRAAGIPEYAEKAAGIFDRIGEIVAAPGLLEPKFNPGTRPSQGFALPMIMTAVAQELRRANPHKAAYYNNYIDRAVDTIASTFMDREHRCILEQVGPGGERQFDHFEGRQLNPGHSIEASWFIMNESRLRAASNGGRREERFTKLGAEILDWMWDWGWDKEYGGIIYFRDALGLPGVEYWHDMKFWWPQTEAIIATLMAYAETGEKRFAERFDAIYDWTTSRFPDRECGEWYGYLHRDGRVSTELKGNMYKGPFHIPRMYIECDLVAKGLLEGKRP